MASELKVDKFTGVTTAGSIDVVGEGNSTTTNLQQGLAKQWFNQNSGDTPRDSFNVASITDNSTGDDSYSFTNNMVNDDYACVPAGWRDHDHFHATAENQLTSSSSRCRGYVRGGTSAVDTGYKAACILGDLA